MVAIIKNSDVVQERVEIFNRLVSQWSGRYVSSLSVSYGIVAAKEYPDLNFESLLKTADDIMYQRKKQRRERK